MTSGEAAALEALRARQGAGARFDAATAPHDDLLMARRGTAYFARKLNELDDAALDAASLRAGWSRRALIAHVSYHARGLARLVEGARTGEALAIYPSAEARDAEIELGATLPAQALRHLFTHTARHLDIEWRDLSDAGWDVPVALLDGTMVAVRETPCLRAAEIWHAAIDLGNGGRVTDMPEALRR